VNTMQTTGSPADQLRAMATMALTVAAIALSPFAAATACVLAAVRPHWRRATDFRLCLGGLALVAVFFVSGALADTLGAGWHAFVSVPGGAVLHLNWATERASSGLLVGWALLLPLAPTFGYMLDVVRPKPVARKAHDRRAREERDEQRRADKAAQRNSQAPITAQAAGQSGIVLGTRISGEAALPATREGFVVLSLERLARHAVVAGATGAGKTETALRIIYALAKSTRMPLFYLDGKGDRHNARRFCAVMGLAGRQPMVFPEAGFDGWRGAPADLQNRLLEVVGLPSEGDAVWYRYVASLTLELACAHPDGAPASARALVERLDLDTLKAAHTGNRDTAALTRDKVADVRLRYASFFGQVNGALDGHWAWEDTDAAYLLLPGLARKDERSALARFLFEDFAHYFTTRKPTGQPCLLVVDEFSAIAEGGAMAERVEQARGFHAALILIPQVVAGMGGPEQAARILGNVDTVLLHRTNTPEEFADLAGTKHVIEESQHTQNRYASGEGSSRDQHQRKIDLNEARSLPTGTAYAISHGLALKTRITRAPNPPGPRDIDTSQSSVAPLTTRRTPIRTRAQDPPELPY